VQKYEKGVNRIGASGLRKIARVLEVSPSYFSEGAPKGDLNISDFEESDVVSFARDFLPTGEGLQLNRAFVAIKDPKVRKKILELVSLPDTCEG
jgi:transcriptional regulator with XRE-family HTH domain